ncbi:MAG: alanine racemase [Gammaproteobacteria bacterium]|nr:alanine racemase [Gammaproteobacteria bacterium]
MEIDLESLTDNWNVLRSLVGPGINIIPALKGNAYGHGIELLTSHLSQLEPVHLCGRYSGRCERYSKR